MTSQTFHWRDKLTESKKILFCNIGCLHVLPIILLVNASKTRPGYKATRETFLKQWSNDKIGSNTLHWLTRSFLISLMIFFVDGWAPFFSQAICNVTYIFKTYTVLFLSIFLSWGAIYLRYLHRSGCSNMEIKMRTTLRTIQIVCLFIFR